MKKLLVLFTILFTLPATAGIYTNTNFHPYIGIDAVINIADYTNKTELDESYYSATINAGARIGRNFGVELFFTHSSTNELDYMYDYFSTNLETYFMAFGFDIYGYYNITKEFDFFTTFGVANYKTYNKYTYIDSLIKTSEKTDENDVSTRLGIGLMYTFPGDNISALLRYQYTPINNEFIQTISDFSFGIRYTF